MQWLAWRPHGIILVKRVQKRPRHHSFDEATISIKYDKRDAVVAGISRDLLALVPSTNKGEFGEFGETVFNRPTMMENILPFHEPLASGQHRSRFRLRCNAVVASKERIDRRLAYAVERPLLSTVHDRGGTSSSETGESCYIEQLYAACRPIRLWGKYRLASQPASLMHRLCWQCRFQSSTLACCATLTAFCRAQEPYSEDQISSSHSPAPLDIFVLDEWRVVAGVRPSRSSLSLFTSRMRGRCCKLLLDDRGTSQ